MWTRRPATKRALTAKRSLPVRTSSSSPRSTHTRRLDSRHRRVSIRVGRVPGFFGVPGCRWYRDEVRTSAWHQRLRRGHRIAAVASLGVTICVLASGVASAAGALYTTDPANRLVFQQYGGVVLSLADLNRDGHPDVVLESSSGVRVIPSIGDGTFAAEIDSPVGASSLNAAAADFDGDGNQDLAVTAPTPQTSPPTAADKVVTVLRGDGSGRFQDPHPLTTSSVPFLISAADMNADGRPDLVVSEGQGGDSDTAVFLNQGSFAFASPVAYAPSGPTSSSGDTAAVGDVNGDGRPDMVIHTGGALKVLLGNGDGTFQNPVAYPLGSHDGRVALGDLNGDGRDDVVATSLYDKSLTYSLSNSDGTLQPAQPLALDVPTDARVADLNGDGKQDIIATTDFGTEPALFLGKGDGTFNAAQAWGSSGELMAGIDDFNSDGQPDVFTANSAGVAALNIYLNQSLPSYTAGPRIAGNPPATVGATVGAGEIKVTNLRGGFLKPSVSLSGADAGEFSIAATDCGQKLMVAGESCTASFNFHPSSPGAKTAAYTVTPLRGESKTGSVLGTAVAVVGATNQPPVTITQPASKRCLVPRLKGLTLKRAKRTLKAAHCRLGRVARRHGRRVVVARQSPKAGSRRAAQTKVSLILGPRKR